MTDLSVTNNIPMKIVAQDNEVTVFQTFAYEALDIIANDNIADRNTQRVAEDTARQTRYGQLNLGLHVNDNAAHVLDNRMRLLAAINQQLNSQRTTGQQSLAIKSLHWVNQVHGKNIHSIEASTLDMHPVNADAMITQQPNSGLAMMTADCVPIVLYQPASGQIAAIHAGWQGLACGVIKAAVERFDEVGQIKAWIGVCISEANYEVGHDVLDKLLSGCIDNQLLTSCDKKSFEQRYGNFDVGSDQLYPDNLHKKVDNIVNIATIDTINTTNVSKIKLNLPRLAADQLDALAAKVCTQLPIDCSYADERYYSYRRQTHLQQRATGRMALIIVRHAATTDATAV